MLKVHLGLCRSFPYSFIVADVPHPITGAADEDVVLAVVVRNSSEDK